MSAVTGGAPVKWATIHIFYSESDPRPLVNRPREDGVCASASGIRPMSGSSSAGARPSSASPAAASGGASATTSSSNRGPGASASPSSAGADSGVAAASTIARTQQAAGPPVEMPEFDLFSTRRPRNLMAGTSSGLKSVIKGAASGTFGLFAHPIKGAATNGFAGFCSGLASGLIGFVALPVAGAAVGAMQVGRGLVNSAEAVLESNAGKEWDQEKRQWYTYRLSDDAERVRALDEFEEGAASEIRTCNPRISRAQPVDRETGT